MKENSSCVWRKRACLIGDFGLPEDVNIDFPYVDVDLSDVPISGINCEKSIMFSPHSPLANCQMSLRHRWKRIFATCIVHAKLQNFRRRLPSSRFYLIPYDDERVWWHFLGALKALRKFEAFSQRQNERTAPPPFPCAQVLRTLLRREDEEQKT